MIAFWAVWKIVQYRPRRWPLAGTPLRRLFAFWIAFLVAEAVGALVAVAIDFPRDMSLVVHDVAAYPLMIAVSCLAVLEPRREERLRRVSWIMSGVGAALLVAQYANAMDVYAVPKVDPWYWDRMRGWTANPNQFALMCAALCLLSAHLFETAQGQTAKIAAAVATIVPILIGAAAKTNAFTLTIGVGFALYLGLRAYAFLTSDSLRSSPRTLNVWIFALLLPLVASGAGLVAISATPTAQLPATALARDGSAETDQEIQTRFTLWKGALARGLESALLGLGPGPHLAIPPEIIEGRTGAIDQASNLSSPEIMEAPNFEAHNTLLEIFAQAGLIGAAAFATIVMLAFINAIAARKLFLAALLAGLMVFGSFHVVLRHPIVWLIIAMCLAARRENRDERADPIAP
jgi:O-antigen ligase